MATAKPAKGTTSRRKPAKAPAPKRKRAARQMTVTTPEAPVFDTMRGQVNIWIVLSADPGQLASEIVAGDHDAYLGDVYHCERSQKNRHQVIAACVERRGGVAW